MFRDVEAVLLTGGASRRMGLDKAKLPVEGEELAPRIARLLAEARISVTVCGRESLPGHAFQADETEFAGPLSALGRFRPSKEFVFVASCDLPGFHPSVVKHLWEHIGDSEAAVPMVGGKLQPLCGLYRGSAFAIARELVHAGERRVMRWLDQLRVVRVADIDPTIVANVNTPDDLPTR